MKVSIVIPTYNEELYLPRLLESIRKQTFRDYEVIVADADSTDKTVQIAKKFGAKVVQGGLPAKGRNAGARHAAGDFIFFLDADVKLPKTFIEKSYKEMQEKYYDLATCEFKPISTLNLDKAIHRLMNMAIRLSLKIDPSALGFCIFTTKRLFERTGGFDETIKIAEDSEFVKRSSKIRPLEYLETAFLYVSVRRFSKEGRFAYSIKGLKIILHRIFSGEIRDDIFEYEFGKFSNRKRTDAVTNAEKLEETVIKMEKDFIKFRKILLQYIDLHKNQADKKIKKKSVEISGRINEITNIEKIAKG